MSPHYLLVDIPSNLIVCFSYLHFTPLFQPRVLPFVDLIIQTHNLNLIQSFKIEAQFSVSEKLFHVTSVSDMINNTTISTKQTTN